MYWNSTDVLEFRVDDCHVGIMYGCTQSQDSKNKMKKVSLSHWSKNIC